MPHIPGISNSNTPTLRLNIKSIRTTKLGGVSKLIWHTAVVISRREDLVRIVQMVSKKSWHPTRREANLELFITT